MNNNKNTKSFYNTTIPSDWEVKELNDLTLEMKSGLSRQLSNEDIGLPVIRSNNLIDNQVDFKDIKYWYIVDNQGANTENYYLSDGDILVNFINSISQIGKCAYFNNTINRPVIFTTNILAVKFKNNKIDSRFFLYHSLQGYYRKFVESITKPAINQASFTTKDYRKLKIPLPPLPEQRAIAHILSLMDNLINKNNQLITQKELQKKWLMQNLLTGKKRLKGFGGEWKIKTLKNILKVAGKPFIPIEEELYLQIGIRSHTKGIFYKEKVTGAAIGNKRVFWIEPNCFVVNIVFAWEHAIAKTTEKEVGMIASHRFPMYKPKEEILDLDFLLYYFKSPKGKSLLGLASPGGAGRNKTLGKSEFMKLQIPVPSIEEQTAIAHVIQAVDKEIQLLKTKTEKLREQKKGMMQLLLTGKKRLTIK